METVCQYQVSSVSSLGASHSWTAMCYPLLITASGILVCLLTTLLATDFRPARAVDEIESTLKNQLIVSTVIMTPVRLTPGFPVAIASCGTSLECASTS